MQARGNLEGHGSRTSGNCLHVSSVSFFGSSVSSSLQSQTVSNQTFTFFQDKQ